MVELKAQELAQIVYKLIGSVLNPIKGQLYTIPLTNMPASMQLNKFCRAIISDNQIALADIVKVVKDHLANHGFAIKILPTDVNVKPVGPSAFYHFEFCLRQAKEILYELQRSNIDGIGVFAVQDIKAGDLLQLFGDEFQNIFVPLEDTKYWNEQMKRYSQKFGIRVNKPNAGYWLPADPHHLQIGNYLNHSTLPNAYHDDNYDYFAAQDIPAGTEITIDYGDLSDADNLPS